MARKLLIPVFPSERFYDAVVAAADLISQEGGLITFLFTEVRAPEESYSDDEDGHPSSLDVALGSGEIDAQVLEGWREKQIAALQDARQLLYDHGVGDEHIDYAFADWADDESPGQAIADEASAGAYDMVVLAKGYLEEEVDEQGSPPREILQNLEESLGEETRLLVV